MNAERRMRAHTLLEVLIAMLVGLLVLAAAGALYHAQRIAQRRADDAFALRDAAGTALMLIGQQVQMAGFRPLDVGASSSSSSWSPVFGCASARMRGDAAQLQCDSVRQSSDALLVRYIGDAVSTWPTASGQVSDCLGQGVGMPAEQPLVANRFDAHVSPSTGEPELYCEGSGRAGVPQPVVSGIEQLRVRYLRRGDTQFVRADVMRPDDWRNVVAVHLCVQARGEAMHARVRYTDCDERVSVAHDGRARVALHRIVALRNASVRSDDRASSARPAREVSQ
ncbi:PilW family protein [Burkholderia multivorans]|uniref:Type IV pillus assembly protein n=1 Tax=Burkholderia multivorans TaxID=87883 RepID=A0AB37B0R5_9BURK|nr:PilW family protein [Burkholderia multivorans]PRE53513.1 type IV pillus assembly protein [Burkholderia multivorans]PRE53825.1 type IV pillus assembly protein [Burkholderia multivorans]